MSKLVDRIQQISLGKAQPMGFGAASREKSLPVLIVASAPSNNAAAIDAAIKGNADALLLSVKDLEKEKQSLSAAVSALGKTPLGVALDAVTQQDMDRLKKIGCDFVVFTGARTQASIFGEEGMGKIMRLDPSLSDGLVRAIGHLDIDAVFINLVSESQSPLTVHDFMSWARLTGSAGKQVLAAIPDDLSNGDLENLMKLGVRAVALDVTSSDAGDRLSHLREQIQKLPPSPKKKNSKSMAILPAVSKPEEPPPPEQDDDDDEGD